MLPFFSFFFFLLNHRAKALADSSHPNAVFILECTKLRMSFKGINNGAINQQQKAIVGIFIETQNKISLK